jgi:5'-3' exonuclease
LRSILFDADALAYRAAAACQTEYDWGDGVVGHATNLPAAKKVLREGIDHAMSKLEADRLVICLSDDFHCFRSDVDPTYKQNRTTVVRPTHLYDLKSWLQEKYPFDLRRHLEADDVMGILSTEPAPGDDRIIYSADKDMQTIPGLLFRPLGDNPELQVVTLEEADRYHLYQALMGDSTDGYAGCPGVGPKGAAEALDWQSGVESYVHTFKAGPRKGASEVRWRPVQMDRPWDIVVSLFEKAGLTAKHALVQARLARILRHGEWDGAAILWNPPAPN